MSQPLSRPHDIQDSLLPYLALLFAGLAWLVPDHYPPWSSFYNEFLAFLALLLLLLHCARSAQRTITVPASAAVVATLAVIPAIQVATGLIHFAGDGWMAAAYLLGLALAIAAGFVLARPAPPMLATALAWLLVAGAAVSALLAVHQALGLNVLGTLVTPFSPLDNRPYANLAQPNQLATLLCLGLVALLYLRATRGIPLAAGLALGLFLIIGVTLTQSRAPWLGAVALVAWWLLKRKTLPEISGTAIAAGLALYAGLILFWPDSAITRAEKSLAPALSLPAKRHDLTDAGTHLQNWQEMTRAVLNQPWTGYGWNQVSVAHVQNARDRSVYAELLSHSHNLLLDLLVWNGLPLGLLLIAALGYWLWTRAAGCRTPESWFALAAMGFVGAHALVEYPLDYAYFLLPVGVLAGLIEAGHPQTARIGIPAWTAWLAVAVYAAFMALVWHEYRVVEEDYRLMRFETRNIGSLRAAQPAPDLILLTQLREDLRMARSLARPGMSADELAWMRKVTYRYPYYSNLFRYSVSLALNQRQAEARREFRRLRDIYGEKPYEDAKLAVRQLADTQYPALKTWQLP
jgi:O-antigen ligase